MHGMHEVAGSIPASSTNSKGLSGQPLLFLSQITVPIV